MECQRKNPSSCEVQVEGIGLARAEVDIQAVAGLAVDQAAAGSAGVARAVEDRAAVGSFVIGLKD